MILLDNTPGAEQLQACCRLCLCCVVFAPMWLAPVGEPGADWPGTVAASIRHRATVRRKPWDERKRCRASQAPRLRPRTAWPCATSTTNDLAAWRLAARLKLAEFAHPWPKAIELGSRALGVGRLKSQPRQLAMPDASAHRDCRVCSMGMLL